ncbi:MAG TPA: hypothetical protein VGL58_04710 [Caulobacteraceae bacterium]|jgi:hypothetical protein
MSRSTKTSQIWSELADARAARAGFERTRFSLDGEAFARDTEITPIVQMLFRRTNGLMRTEAYFGVSAEPFEQQWAERLRQTSASITGGYPPLSLHAANVASLRPRPWVDGAPSDQDVANVANWLDRAFEYAGRYPHSVGDLREQVEAGRIVDGKPDIYLMHPVKVRGFTGWLRETHGLDLGGRLHPFLEDRTYPYDTEIMLAPGWR